MMLTSGMLVHNRYRIVKPIGKGGMGAVYEALDTRLSSTVALKQTLFSGNAQLIRAFEHEAKLLASLRHPALTKVIDYFSEDSGHFLVMEFITGKDMMELLQDRGEPFPVDDGLEWATQLLKALDYLHNQATPVIHRDIKPHNLKLTDRNEIVLLDFGLAKGQVADSQALLTGQHSLAAYTLQYAPLEQIEGSGTNARTDLYSLAGTFYHLLTNQLPADAISRASAALNKKPDPLKPLHELNPEIPLIVSDLLVQAMSLQSEERPASADEMRQVIEQARRQLEAGTAAVADPTVFMGPSTLPETTLAPPPPARPISEPASAAPQAYSLPQSSPGSTPAATPGSTPAAPPAGVGYAPAPGNVSPAPDFGTPDVVEVPVRQSRPLLWTMLGSMGCLFFLCIGGFLLLVSASPQTAGNNGGDATATVEEPTAEDSTIEPEEPTAEDPTIEPEEPTTELEEPGNSALGMEAEPRGPIALGETRGALLDSATKAHDWTFDGLANQVVTIQALAAEGTSTDPRITLLGPDGNYLIDDDDSGDNLNAIISDYTLPADGIYTIRVDVFEVGPYSLVLQEAGGDFAESDFNVIDQGPIAVGEVREATITDASEVHDWTFDGLTDEVVTIEVRAFEGESTDPLVSLYGPDGTLLETFDDAADTTDAILSDYTLPADGTYIVSINTWVGGSYTISVQPGGAAPQELLFLGYPVYPGATPAAEDDLIVRGLADSIANDESGEFTNTEYAAYVIGTDVTIEALGDFYNGVLTNDGWLGPQYTDPTVDEGGNTLELVAWNRNNEAFLVGRMTGQLTEQLSGGQAYLFLFQVQQ